MRGVKNFYNIYRTFIQLNWWSIKSKIRRNKGHKLVKPDHERAVPIIEGIITDSNHQEISVNLPNVGIITNLSEDLVVECPAIVTKSGLKGIPLGDYPEPLVELLREEANVQDLVVKAVLNNSREYAVKALKNDANFPRKHLIDKFLDEMLELQKEWVSLE